MRQSPLRIVLGTLLAVMLCSLPRAQADVKPGDVITKDNASKVADLLSPGNYVLVREGMQLRIVPTDKLDWPPPFRAATEKYSPQVQLGPDGTLKGYVSGQPFPLVDPNDPQVALKVMWNFSYRPLYSDDIDMRYPEVASFDKNATGSPLSYYTVGHFAFYNNIGRIEVPPIPTDPDGVASGIRYRFGFYPFMEPSSLRGYGMVRQRHIDPTIEDNVWVFSPATRKLRRQSAAVLSDAIGALPGFSGGGGSGAAATGAAVVARAAAAEPALSLTRSILTHTSASRRKSKISTTDSWARSRCSRRCTPCIRPSRNARSTAARPFARKTGRCAICT